MSIPSPSKKVAGWFRGVPLFFLSGAYHHSTNVLELRIPLMASSFLIVKGCRIIYTAYTPKTRYSLRASMSCASLTPSLLPSASPGPNWLQFRSQPVGRMPTTEHRPPNDPLTNWRYLLDQKPDKGAHETVMFWFLGSDSEQHEPLSDTMPRE